MDPLFKHDREIKIATGQNGPVRLLHMANKVSSQRTSTLPIERRSIGSRALVLPSIVADQQSVIGSSP